MGTKEKNTQSSENNARKRPLTIGQVAVKVLAFLTAMAGAMVLLYLAFFSAVMNKNFLKDANLKIGTHELLGMSEEDLEKVALSMVLYTKSETDTLQVQVTMDGEQRDFYNEKELIHIKDCRDLVTKVRIFIACCGGFFVLGTVVLFILKRPLELGGGFLVSCGVMILLGLVIGLAALIDIDGLIKGFHYMFFDNDLWLLDPRTDMVVWFFREEMYGKAVSAILMNLCGIFLPLGVASVGALRMSRGMKK